MSTLRWSWGVSSLPPKEMLKKFLHRRNLILLFVLPAVAVLLFLALQPGSLTTRLWILQERASVAIRGTELFPSLYKQSEGGSCMAAPITFPEDGNPAGTASILGKPLASTAGQVETPDAAVGKWDLYEITLTSNKTYPNPFTGVDVYADFTSPTGRVIRVYGFHDGNGNGGQGNLWRIRFMGDELGVWSWKTTSTDPSNTGLHNKTGSVQITAPTGPGPIAPDPYYPNAWRHAEGNYFYWNVGYSIHIAGADPTHPGVGGWQDYLDWLEAHRFNGVMFTLQVPSFGACSTCAKGMAPWSALGGNPPPTWAYNNNNKVDYFVMPWAKQGDPNATATTAADVDYGRFYLPFWENVDAILADMQEKEMIAHVWQYSDQTFHPNANSSDEHRYWDYMIRRLGAHWNVTFNDGIDLFEYRTAAWVGQWQQYFCDNMPFYHPLSSRHGNDDLSTAAWRSLQAPSPGGVNAWRNILSNTPRKPATEDDGVRALKDNGIPPERFMELAWWSVLAGPGGFGVTWAGAYEPGNWYSNMDANNQGMLRVEHRTRFILDFDPASGKQIPFWRMEPHDELVNGSGVNAVAVPGSHYLVYFNAGSGGTATLNLNAINGSLPITWINAVTGQRVSGGTANPGSLTLVNPFGGPAAVYIGMGEVPGSTPPPAPINCNAPLHCSFVPIAQRNSGGGDR